MNSNKTQIPKGPFKFLLYTSRPYRAAAFLAVFCVLVSSVISPLVPYIFKRIIDSVNQVPGLGPESVLFWTSLYVGTSFIEAMFWRGSAFAGMRLATGVRATGREKLTEYVTGHGYEFFSNRFAGALANKIKNASDGVNSMVGSILWDWIGFFVMIGVGLGLVFYTNFYVGLIFVFWIVIITPFNLFMVKGKIPRGIAAQRLETKLQGDTIDILTNINAMRDYARRGFELEHLRELIKIRRVAGMRNWAFGEWVLVINTIIEAFFTGGMMFATVYAWNLHLVTAGDIIMVFGLIVVIRSDLAHLGSKFNNFSENVSQIKEGLGEILHAHEIIDTPDAEKLVITNGEIVLDNVSFQYEDHEIFKNLSLTIHSGERIGLIGRSGAGKSTLMKLLTRQYDLGAGNILIDGQDITRVKQDSLREAIAVVPQEPLLFHRTLKANIKYGNLSVGDEEITEAAEQAQARDFIEALPKKYDTLVGERGIKLSGGERQRVAIARAFLKQAKILLLDEATSSLDSESEAMIQKALEKLMEGKTVIAIAHRLSTLRAMDRLLIIDNGQIIEDGTHDELLKLGGIYAELWSHQAGGFIKSE